MSNAKKMSPAQKATAVRSRLRTGDFAEIARRTGYDQSHVARVIRGTSNNPSGEILNAAYTMVSRRRATV